jgi:VWFA-related protein
MLFTKEVGKVSLRLIALSLLAFVLFCAASSVHHAQGGKPALTPRPTPTPAEDQEPVRVFTEEVRLPVVATDDYGHFDPTLDADDLIVFEDGVQQEIKSVRRIPASVLLLLSTGGDMDPAMRVSTTRETAQRLVQTLKPGDQMAVLQFTNRVEVVQPWTADDKQVEQTLKTKLHSGSGSRLAEAINAAAAFFVNQPLGNRHLVLITDGVEMPVGRASYDEAMKILSATGDAQSRAEWEAAVKRLIEAQASVHVISYTEFARLAFKGKQKKYKGSNAPPGSVLSSGIQNAGIDPTIPPGMNRGMGVGTSGGVGINFDPQMRRLHKAYEKAMKSSEQRLGSLAEETGALIVKPESAEEMIDKGAEVARDIGAQYVITYVPKRPLADARPGEYRRVQVAPRRSGLTVRSRRGYIVTPAP